MADVDPPPTKEHHLIKEDRESVARLRGEKASTFCNIREELLKPEDEAMIRGLHVVFAAAWESGTIPHNW